MYFTLELQTQGIKILKIVECGDARQKIDEHIAAHSVDLVVLGKRKRSAIKKIINTLGTVTTHVSKTCPVPVLIVP